MSNPHVPNDKKRAKVIAFTCAGFTQEEVARYLNIDIKTLVKYYKQELDEAKYEKIGELSDIAYQLARAGDQKMLEFVLKCRGRWSYYKPPEDDKKSTTDTLIEKLIDRL